MGVAATVQKEDALLAELDPAPHRFDEFGRKEAAARSAAFANARAALLLAPGATLTDAELAALPIATGLPRNWIVKTKQETVTVDGVARTAVSAEVKFGATVIIIR